jgi:hypothetical protein
VGVTTDCHTLRALWDQRSPELATAVVAAGLFYDDPAGRSLAPGTRYVTEVMFVGGRRPSWGPLPGSLWPSGGGRQRPHVVHRRIGEASNPGPRRRLEAAYALTLNVGGEQGLWRFLEQLHAAPFRYDTIMLQEATLPPSSMRSVQAKANQAGYFLSHQPAVRGEAHSGARGGVAVLPQLPRPQDRGQVDG